ncbi:hypothetical protein [Arsenophonus sp. ENCA]|uniref:hypothetical protein n=1 Tax=Arsenophonus sp. ENCA TaxID=1987579 RepID=UPI0025B8489D|nr:hypothetical protein [Arsenophonus sp. ENCA]
MTKNASLYSATSLLLKKKFHPFCDSLFCDSRQPLIGGFWFFTGFAAMQQFNGRRQNDVTACMALYVILSLKWWFCLS